VLLREETGLPITITEDALSTVVLGSGLALDNIAVLKDVMIQ
jgi:rod shape-determining protein MreB